MQHFFSLSSRGGAAGEASVENKLPPGRGEEANVFKLESPHSNPLPAWAGRGSISVRCVGQVTRGVAAHENLHSPCVPAFRYSPRLVAKETFAFFAPSRGNFTF